MEKVWIKRYPRGVPAEIDPDRFTSLAAMFEESCRKFADHPAFTNFGTTMTFAEFDSAARDFAAYLQKDLGLAKGDRVAVMIPNLLQYPVAVFGILRAGLVVVNVNPLYSSRELEYQLNDAGAETILIFSAATPALAAIVANTPIRTVIVTKLDDMLANAIPSPDADSRLANPVSFTDALARGRELSLAPVELRGEDLAFLQYTGGTTGVSKGAMLTHRNIVANVEQFVACTSLILEEGKEIIVTALPLYHIFALMLNCCAYVRLGGLNILITNPKDITAFVTELGKWKFTSITAVNTLFNGLASVPAFTKLDHSALKLCVGGGAAVQRAVAEKWELVTGCHILEGYGLSETSPILTLNSVDQTEFSGSIGIPFPSTELSIRDVDGNEVPMGEAGELCARGPQVMAGYWRREDATREVTTADGFFRTGDVATVDEQGFFRIVDRIKDMVLVSGFNVYPNEIEAVVQHCDGVLENACIGIPDEKTGEAVKLFVVKQQGLDINEQDLRAQCKSELAAYKVPKYIEFVDELPKSNVGKILRRELRDREMARRSDQAAESV